MADTEGVREGVTVALADARSDRLDVGVRVGVGLRVRVPVTDRVAVGVAAREALPRDDMVAEGEAPVDLVAVALDVADAATAAGGRVSLTVRHPETEEKATVEMTQRQTGMLSAMLTEAMSHEGDEDF